MRNLRMFKELVGNSVLPNVILVTTMWNNVDTAIGAERENELATNSRFWGDMVSRGSTVVRFDGTRDCAYDILRLRLTADTRILTIQREIVDGKIKLAETGAGKEVLAEMTKLKLLHQRDMSRLQSDMEEALNKRDKVAAEGFARVSNQYREELARAEAQINVLQSRSPEIESLQIRHEQELQRLRDSLEDRIGSLEEQTSIPPPSYVEAETAFEENVRSFS